MQVTWYLNYQLAYVWNLDNIKQNKHFYETNLILYSSKLNSNQHGPVIRIIKLLWTRQ